MKKKNPLWGSSRVTGYVVINDKTGRFFNFDEEHWTEDRLQAYLFEKWGEANDYAKRWGGRTISEGTALCDRLQLAATFSEICARLDNCRNGYKAAVEKDLHLQHTDILRALVNAMYKNQQGELGLSQTYLSEVAALAILAMHASDLKVEKKALAASKKTTRGTFPVRVRNKRPA